MKLKARRVSIKFLHFFIKSSKLWINLVFKSLRRVFNSVLLPRKDFIMTLPEYRVVKTSNFPFVGFSDALRGIPGGS